MRSALSKLLLVAALLWAAPAGLATAADKAEPGRVGEERASHELDDLRQRIRDAQRDLSATESSRSEAADALRKSEQAISEATRRLRALGQQENATQTTLSQLAAAQAQARQAIADGQARLAALLRHQYRAGGDDSVPALLSGSDPDELARDGEYLRQLARARQAAVAGLRHDLERLSALDHDARDKAGELARTRDARSRERNRLQQESANHAQTVATLSSRLQEQRHDLQGMQRDEKRLTDLVERIARAIEERRLAREKAARERAARERQEREKAARLAREHKAVEAHGGNAAGSGEAAEPEPHKPPEVVAKIDESAEEGYDTEAFARMKGRMRLPVTGELVNRFGSPREDSGLDWKGLYIRAPQGREVHAVAAGRVVYADWLRGFGNLLIVDHGSGYMSLYGNLESLFVGVGEVVKSGAAIAAVGNSGGNPEPGLYFEIRHLSRPFDPMSWVGKP